jgi:hypothetical protein
MPGSRTDHVIVAAGRRPATAQHSGEPTPRMGRLAVFCGEFRMLFKSEFWITYSYALSMNMEGRYEPSLSPTAPQCSLLAFVLSHATFLAASSHRLTHGR